MDIQDIREYCLSLSGVTEDIKWENDLCFCVAEKMFCVTALEGDFGVSLKVQAEEFEILSVRDDIKPAPYLARAMWISLLSSEALSPDEWRFYIQQSYQLIKSKLSRKIQREIEKSA